MADPLSARVVGLYNRILDEPHNSGIVAELAICLADSGVRRDVNVRSADIASSGGPGSLSTLLCPLHLVDIGLTVPKIGVPGRPAGGIDVLGAIPGYRTHLSPVEFDDVVTTVGYAHVLADETWAPADAALFRLRQERGTQANPALAAASLLAKKLAAGVQIAALDVRVAKYGNFGATTIEARKSAGLYCDAGLQLGLRPVVFLTDNSVPYQPFIGRSEAMRGIAMVALGDIEDEWLNGHARMCLEMARIVESFAPPPSAETAAPLAGAGIVDILAAHLGSQGCSLAALDAQVSWNAAQARQLVYAAEDGFVHYDLSAIRDLILGLNRPENGQRGSLVGVADYLDLAGARLLCPPDRKVRRGEAVVELRGWPGPAAAFAKFEMFTIEEFSAGKPNIIQEVVTP